MKKVYQKQVDDCLPACIASLFEYPLKKIPVFRGSFWDREYKDFIFNTFGYSVVFLSYPESDIFEYFLDGCLVICKGTSLGGLNHAVICKVNQDKLELIHDPHPEGGGVDDIKVVDIFVKYFNAEGIK